MNVAEKVLQLKQDFDDVYEVGYSKGSAEHQAIVDSLINGTLTELTSNVKSVRGYALQMLGTLHYVTFPEAITIGEYAFNGCSTLWMFTAPKAETISQRAFNNCGQVGTMDLPSVKSIHTYAFNNMGSLKTLIIRTTDCTLSATNAFSGTPIASGTGYIYVPDDAVETYKVGTNWATYANQIKGISELPT